MSKVHETHEAIDVRDLPDLEQLAEEVRRTGEPRMLRRADEELAMIVPVPKRRRPAGRVKTAADRKAFLSSAGGWRDLVDTDQLVADIYESRRLSSRPPVELRGIWSTAM